MHDELRRRAEARTAAAVQPLPVRGRVKTRDTLLATLVRAPGVDLANVQDLVGVRVVVRGGRREQDAVVAAVQRAFPVEPA